MIDPEKMNYCCDCEWAVRKGWVFKTWHCTNKEVNKIFGGLGYDRDPVTCEPFRLGTIKCWEARGFSSMMNPPCKHYKGELRGHTLFPPRKNPNPIPSLPPNEAAINKARGERQ